MLPTTFQKIEGSSYVYRITSKQWIQVINKETLEEWELPLKHLPTLADLLTRHYGKPFKVDEVV